LFILEELWIITFCLCVFIFKSQFHSLITENQHIEHITLLHISIDSIKMRNVSQRKTILPDLIKIKDIVHFQTSINVVTWLFLYNYMCVLSTFV